MPGSRDRALKLFDRAYERQQAGAHEEAITLYQASLAECPTAEAHTFLGWVYSFSGRLDEAIAECKRAISVDPSLGNPYNDIGVYLMEMGRFDEAIPWLRRATRASRYEAPHFPHMNLARIHERRGEVVAALSELTRASRKMPGVPELGLAIRRLQARVN